MRWFVRAHTGAVLAAVSCLLGSACDDDNNKDVSGAYELFFGDGSVRALLYLIRGTDDDYLAVLDESRCSVVRGADELVLNGCSVLVAEGQSARGSIAANYVSFRIERDSAGDLAQLSAFDQESDVRVDGRIERSRHAPQLRASAPAAISSTARPRLPWDAFNLDFGPGVLMDEATIAEAIDVESSGGDPVEARWSYRSIEVPDSSRKLAYSAMATINWPELAGQLITFSFPAGTPDSAGKTTSNYLDVDFQLPPVAAPARAWELEDDSELKGLVKWGGLTLARDSALCSGSCLQTSKPITPCAEPGLAGQLDALGASKLVVRVRTISQERLGYPLELAIYLGESTTPDGGRSSSRVKLQDRGEPQDSDFRSIELPLSAAQRRARLPYELRLSYGCWIGPNGENAQPADVTVLFDRVAAE